MKKLLSLSMAAAMLFALATTAFAADVTGTEGSLTYDQLVTVSAGLELPTITLKMPTSAVMKFAPYAPTNAQIFSPVYEIVNYTPAPLKVEVATAAIDAVESVLAAAIPVTLTSNKIDMVLNIEFMKKSPSGATVNQELNTWPTPANYTTAVTGEKALLNITAGAITKTEVGVLARVENNDGKPLDWAKGENRLKFRMGGAISTVIGTAEYGKLTSVTDKDFNTTAGLRPTFTFTMVTADPSTQGVEKAKAPNTGATLLKAAKAGSTTNVVFDAAPQKGEEIYVIDSATAVTSDATFEAAIVGDEKIARLKATSIDNIKTSFENTDFEAAAAIAGGTPGTAFNPLATGKKYKVLLVTTNALTGVRTYASSTAIVTNP